MTEKRKVFDPRSPKTGDDPKTIIPESMQVRMVEAADGVPLNSFLKEFGGFQGIVVDPAGNEHKVSLKRWRNADPSTTLIVLEFEFSVRKKGG